MQKNKEPETAASVYKAMAIDFGGLIAFVLIGLGLLYLYKQW